LSLSVVTPEPPFTAALGLAAALGFAFFGVRASWIAVVGGTLEHTPTPLRSALQLCLAFFLRVGVLCYAVVA
jgi:hypothetical protein